MMISDAALRVVITQGDKFSALDLARIIPRLPPDPGRHAPLQVGGTCGLGTQDGGNRLKLPPVSSSNSFL